MGSFQSYEDCIDWLFKQFPSYQKIGSKAYKPTLDNTRKLLELFGNPERQLKFIHVAGSNGKGSVSAYISSLSTLSGYKTGLFTSPHIKDFRERIRIDGEMISEETVQESVERIISMNLQFAPSFFEMTLAMALDHFAKNGCELVVLETGLGGRLDATNVVTPILSIITSISLEHQNILGDTIAEIAGEKAGIIKQCIPVVTGKMEPIALKVIEEKSTQQESKRYDYTFSSLESPSQLIMDYQQVNFKTADTAIQVLNMKGWKFDREKWNRAISELRQNTGFFGRFEIIQKKPFEVWDVSHNAEGIRETLNSFQKMVKNDISVVIGLSADKNIEEIVKIIPENMKVYVTTFNSERSASITQLQDAFKYNNFKSISYFTDPQEALKVAKHKIKDEDGVIVLGSFFLFENLF